ncbi:MAG: type II secretion system F family protein [Pyrinomonadaceae bacterium]
MSAQVDNFARPRAGLLAEDDLVRFNYRGQTIIGDAIRYYIYAHSEEDARRQLEEARISIEEITPHLGREQRRRKNFKREDLGALSLQLSDRVGSGESIAGAVLEIARATRHNLLREALMDVAIELRREGARPADAFRLRPDVFPRAFANMIGIGAKKGDISDVLTKYGESQLRTAENIARFKGALYYPATILTLASVIIGVMCYFVLPQMEEFYASLLPLSHGELPWMTGALLGLSRLMIGLPGLLALVCAIALGAYLVKWVKSVEGREAIERSSLNWPGVGALLRSFHAAYTVHLISILVGAGVTPSELLKETAESSMNVVYREQLTAIREAFQEGGLELQTAFAPYAFLFGDEFQAVIATGEKTGRLDTQLAGYARLLDNRVQETITRLSKLIEPLTLVCAGLIIGLVVIAAYLPLFTLIGQISAAR